MKKTLLKRVLPVLLAFCLAFTFCIGTIQSIADPISWIILSLFFTVVSGLLTGVATGNVDLNEIGEDVLEFITNTVPQAYENWVNNGSIHHDVESGLFFNRYTGSDPAENEVIHMICNALNTQEARDIYFTYNGTISGEMSLEDCKKIMQLGVAEGLSFALSHAEAGATNAKGDELKFYFENDMIIIKRSSKSEDHLTDGRDGW